MKLRALTVSVVVVLSTLTATMAVPHQVAAANQPDVDPGDLQGSGTASDPYVITTAPELQAMEDDLDAYYELGNDIDATGTVGWNSGKGFDPVGDSGTPFTGSLEGDGHTITGLTINRPTEEFVGLFGYLKTGSVTDITLESASVEGKDTVGALVGQNGVGFGAGGTVSGASASGAVRGENSVGGLVGVNAGGTISDSESSASVGGNGDFHGGLVGFNLETVTRSSATGDVTGEDNVGGLAGGNADTIELSFATGDVTGDKNVGGLVGENNFEVSTSYARGSVTGSKNVGGFAGKNGVDATISNSYAAGEVSDGTNAGGFLGNNQNEVTGSYWDVQASGKESSAGGGVTGLLTEEMTSTVAPDNMVAFDFESTWETTEEYPVLEWQEVNTAPSATDDEYSTGKGETLEVDAPGVLDNDDDVNGDELTVSVTDRPSEGELTLSEDGSFVYTPGDGFAGEDTFTYQASDGQGGTDTATVTVTVEGAPDAADDSYSTQEGETLEVDASGLLDNDADPNGDSLTAELASGPSNGELTLGDDGSFEYVPDDGFSGEDTFTYRVSDDDENTDTATVTLTVNGQPEPGDDSYTTTEGERLVVNEPGVLDDDTDPDGNSLVASLASGPENGDVTLNGDGSFEYLPEAGFTGEDSFTYRVRDGQGGTATATVVVQVSPDTIGGGGGGGDDGDGDDGGDTESTPTGTQTPAPTGTQTPAPTGTQTPAPTGTPSGGGGPGDGGTPTPTPTPTATPPPADTPVTAQEPAGDEDASSSGFVPASWPLWLLLALLLVAAISYYRYRQLSEE